MAETLFKGGNHAVVIGSITQIRAQDFRVSTRQPVEEVYQLGNEPAVGVDEGQASHEGSLVWFPINAKTENAIVGVSSTSAAVTINGILAASAVTLSGPANTRGITGALLTSLEYSAQPGGRFQATANFRGTGFDSDGVSITPDTPSGIGAYRTKHIMVQFATTAVTLLRIRSMTVRINFTFDEAYEFYTVDPFDVDIMTPTVSLDLEFYSNYESGTAGAWSYRPLPDLTTPQDVEIQLGTSRTWDASGNLQYILKNMVWDMQDHQVRVQQRAMQRITYRSAQDATLGGWSVQTVT